MIITLQASGASCFTRHRHQDLPLMTFIPWGSALKLKKLELNQALCSHIELRGEDGAEKFLDDQTSMVSVGDQTPDRQHPLQALTDCILAAKIMRRLNIVGAVRYLFRVLLVGYLVVNLYGTKDSINGDQLNDSKDVVYGRYTSMTELEKMSAGVVDVEDPCSLFLGEDGESRYLYEEARDIDYTFPNDVLIKTVIRAADVRGKWLREVLGFVRDFIARKGKWHPCQGMRTVTTSAAPACRTTPWLS